ncbi:MAG: hypothetical protein JXR37_21385 [Kiritimatiellae bacterium]|nr:hypothetical protein [Kiritimatiellia bacterium]
MRHGMIFAILFASSTVCISAAVPRPNLVPLPQQVEALGRPIPWPAAGAVLCAEEAVPMIQVGLAELDKAVTRLGGPAIIRRAGADSGAPFAVIVGTPASPLVARWLRTHGIKLDAGDPGPQGYVIRFLADGANTRVLLAGSDAQGALYACVTFSQMLRREGARLVVDAANVRDWPDFRLRVIGRFFQSSLLYDAVRGARTREEYLRVCRDHVDFCLRFKINGITLRFAPLFQGRAQSNVQAIGQETRAALREVSEYAAQRGVLLEMKSHSAIDVGQGGPASEIKDLVEARGARFSWSHDELIREQGRVYGRFARETGIGLYYLHSPDVWQYGRYAGWHERSAHCRARWKDDERAKADAHVMNLLAGEIRALSPATRICAVLIPYGASVDNLDSERSREILGYWREVNERLDPRIAVCVRENRRENVAAFKQAYGRHPIYFYIETCYNNGWKPFFTTSARVLQTFDFDDSRDIFYLGNTGEYAELGWAMTAHYAWNTGAPGAVPHRGYNHDPIHDGTRPPEVAGALLDAICAHFFGEQAGPLMGEAVRGDPSWLFTKEPASTAVAARDRLAGRQSDIPGWEETVIDELDDPARLMQHQADGSRRGLDAVLKVQRMIEAGQIAFDERQQQQFRFVLSYLGAVRAVAAVRAPALAAATAIREKRHEAAQSAARKGLAALPESLRLLTEISAALGGKDNWLWQSEPSLRKRIEAQRVALERLDTLGRGIVIEQADTPANLETAAYLLRRGQVKAAGSEKCALDLSAEHARTPGHPALVFSNPAARFAGATVRFPPVNVRPYLEQNGYLRFYVNSAGPKGAQLARLWCYFRSGEAADEQKRGDWVRINLRTPRDNKPAEKRGFVTVDELAETWQLVSVPLADIARDDGDWLAGFHVNFPRIPECGLVIADPYLIGNTQVAEIKRKVR